LEDLITNEIAVQFYESQFCSIELPLPVHTYDIDIAHHVNNIVYLRWLEDMRSELFTKLNLLESLIALNYYPVVASCESKYKKQIKLLDRPIGKMFLESSSHGILIFKAEIRIDDKIAFCASQKCVIMDLKNNLMITDNIIKII
jgi:acyl-CoA thioester hydrolase